MTPYKSGEQACRNLEPMPCTCHESQQGYRDWMKKLGDRQIGIIYCVNNWPVPISATDEFYEGYSQEYQRQQILDHITNDG